MKPEYIKNFEQLGMGLFCHFGLYSVIGKGEWWHTACQTPEELKEYESIVDKFKIKKNWAKDLVSLAKKSGAKYITLTTRHHDGFSLYDTCGLNTYDAPHSASKRDLIREFVDECNKQGIVPFFYHTLLDWWHPDFENNFSEYLVYLRKSIEILCKNYGKIGGFWFDGSWSKDSIEVWEFEKLYAIIRKYQPDAMIINNTGLVGEGEISHPEIDSVTFERGKPVEVKTNGKEIAGEMCDGITDHWGYAKLDLCTKPFQYLVKSLIECRFNNCNYLINTGLMPDGSVNPREKYVLLDLGRWIKINKNFIYNVKGVSCYKSENALLLKDDKNMYAVTFDVPMAMNENVTKMGDKKYVTVDAPKKIKNAKWLDNNQKINIVDKKINKYSVDPFKYGTSYYARVAKFKI